MMADALEEPSLLPLAVGEPADHQVGPFAHGDFLSVMWRHSAEDGERLVVVADDQGAAALRVGPEEIGLVGPDNLVDYRSTLGRPIEAIAQVLANTEPGRRVRFDSMPDEAASVVEAAMTSAGVDFERHEHESTAVLTLPGSFDDYLASIGKKERHETRRKLRRFEAAVGEPRIVTYTEPGPALQRFFALHRLADGRKAAFMTPAMTRLFTDLVALPGWRVDALYGDGPRSLAATVAFGDDSGYYLYNSAYDPGARDVSPGVVLLATLIRQAIEEGCDVFDFLKGDEPYKYRMGALPRPLHVLEGVT